MPVEITVADDATKYLNTPAVAQLKAASEQYIQDVLQEANRLEAAGKSTKGNPEVTSSMVRDADMLLRRGYSKPKKSRSLIAAQLISTIGGFVVGLLADAEKLKNPTTLVVFVIVLGFTITAAVVAVLKD